MSTFEEIDYFTATIAGAGAPASMPAPYVGQVVAYFPATSEGFGGGHRALPAIVTAVDGGAPDFGLSLAVLSTDARIVARSRPLSAATWRAAGGDPAVGHWDFLAGAQPAS